MIYIIRI